MAPAPQMFTGAHNIIINGGEFTQSVNLTQNIEHPDNGGLDTLRRHCALAAQSDAIERSDPPRIGPGTRVAIVEQMRAWLTSDSQTPSMLWLNGPAGSGKTALAQTFAEIWQEDEELAASFFFSRTTDENRSDGNKLISTLAYQLTSSFRGVRTCIKNRIEADPSILQKTNAVQMQRLFVEPTNRALNKSWRAHFRTFIGVERKRPRLIVIDGLDECHDPETQRNLLQTIGNATRKLHFPFRFLITSRPESHISSTFKHDPVFQNLEFSTIDLLDDEDTDQDILTYLRNEFAEIRRTHLLNDRIPDTWPSEEALADLVKRASAQFVYAATVIKYIQSRQHRPTDRLDIVLGLSPTPENETPFAQLDTLYRHIFSAVGDPERVRKIFGLLAIPRTADDGLGTYTSPEMVERLLPFIFKDGDVQLILDNLRSIVSCPNFSAPIKLLHASLSDFLLNPARSSDFHINIRFEHEVLARSYMRIIRESESPILSLKDSLMEEYVTAALSHAERSALSDKLQSELKGFDILRLFHKHDYPRLSDWSEFITWQANDLRRKWYNKNRWKATMLIKFAHILLRHDVKNGEKAFRFRMRRAEEVFVLDQQVMESLVNLLNQPRFQSCLVDHSNLGDVPCPMQGNPRAAVLLHRTLFMLMLHQESVDFSHQESEGLRLKLIASIFHEESSECVGSLVSSVKLDSYPALGLDCAGTLLGQVYQYSENLVGILLDKFPLEHARNLKADIVKYLKRVEYHIETERLQLLKEKWDYE